MLTTFSRSVKDHLHPKIHLYLLILSMLIQAFGAICTKYAAEFGSYETVIGIPLSLIMYLIILGGMGLQVIVWQYALKYYPLSFAYPFRSLVSFIVLIAAFVLFDESISVMNVAGLSVITIGVFFLARDKEALA
ncbi:MAG: EamA family transporter [Methanoregula sp.]|jgi:multidrug transporter EmrE-like cation transporter